MGAAKTANSASTALAHHKFHAMLNRAELKSSIGTCLCKNISIKFEPLFQNSRLFMDRLEAMSILLAVVEAGSLSGAARRLDMPLPTVSRKLADLEAHLRTRLLHRTTRQLSLTEAGATYVAACRRILDDVAEAERIAADEYATPRGDLTVTAPIVFGRLHIVPVVAQFLAQYPEIRIKLLLTDRVVHLMDEQIDVALRIGELPDSTWMASRVGTVRSVVCGSPAYFTKRGLPTVPQELEAHDCISFDVLESRRAWVFGEGKSKVSVPVISRLSVNTAEAAIAAAILGVGLVRVLSYQVAHAVAEGTLDVVLQAYESAPLPVSLVHKGAHPLPRKLQAFLEFAAPRLRERIQTFGLAAPPALG
jgi:DNA-binding transcriptional LysR family regulator